MIMEVEGNAIVNHPMLKFIGNEYFFLELGIWTSFFFSEKIVLVKKNASEDYKTPINWDVFQTKYLVSYKFCSKLLVT